MIGIITAPLSGIVAAMREAQESTLDAIRLEVHRCGNRRWPELLGHSVPSLTKSCRGTSAYLLVSGTIVSDKVWSVIVEGSDAMGMGHGWTYSAHPLCAAEGVANLELIDTLDLVRNAGEIGAYFRAGLVAALGDHPIVGEVCGDGLMAAVEFVADRDDRSFFDPALKVGPQVSAALLERGVVGRAMPRGDILGFAPPLCLTREEADVMTSAAKGAVDAVAAQL